MLCLKHLAARAELSPSLLATRADIGKLALHGESAAIPLMSGWRREAVGEALLRALRGGATARVAPASLQVRVEWENTSSSGESDP